MEIKIRNYMGIKDLTLKKVSEVNLLTGQNNSGKTRVLKAIEHQNPKDAIYLNEQKLEEEFVKLMERGYDIRKTAKIIGRFFKEVDNIEWWDRTLYITLKDGYKIYGSDAGSGLLNSIYLVACVLFSNKKYILLDEVLNPVHYSKMSDILRWLIYYCQERDTILFLTTHSKEVVDFTLDLTFNNPVDVSLYHLKVRGGDVTVTRMNKKEAFYWTIYGLELRGSKD